MNITAEELARLENACDRYAWNAACDAIKATRRGKYPPDWFTKVILSGMMDRVRATWRSKR